MIDRRDFANRSKMPRKRLGHPISFKFWWSRKRLNEFLKWSATGGVHRQPPKTGRAKDLYCMSACYDESKFEPGLVVACGWTRTILRSEATPTRSAAHAGVLMWTRQGLAGPKQSLNVSSSSGYQRREGFFSGTDDELPAAGRRSI